MDILNPLEYEVVVMLEADGSLVGTYAPIGNLGHSGTIVLTPRA